MKLISKAKVWTIGKGELEFWNGLNMDQVYREHSGHYHGGKEAQFLVQGEEIVRETEALTRKIEGGEPGPKTIFSAGAVTIATWGDEFPDYTAQAEKQLVKVHIASKVMLTQLKWGKEVWQFYWNGLQMILEDFENLPVKIQETVAEAESNISGKDMFCSLALDDLESGAPLQSYIFEKSQQTGLPVYVSTEDFSTLHRRRVYRVRPYSPILSGLVKNIQIIKYYYVKRYLPPCETS